MMTMRTAQTLEFGDFQTPDKLARETCEVLLRLGISPASVVEPTCGTGSFLRASASAFPKCTSVLGFEINPKYAELARTVDRASVSCVDFFEQDWVSALDCLPEPILVIGNPPWVTNSAVGSMGGGNLPKKSNFQQLSGFEAITGKSNFDISEWMLTHLLGCLSGRAAILAMLCKTVVARKVLRGAWSRELQISRSAMYAIDASFHFGVSVDACLLVCTIGPRAGNAECEVYSSLKTSQRESTFGYRGGRLIADVEASRKYSYLLGTCALKWRSGVKHDCTRVMELRAKGGDTFENGLGEVVSLESTYLYPMLKSSELMDRDAISSRYMIVTQRCVGDNTLRIERDAPRTWKYLQSHADYLDRRASSIYRNRPRFSVFGVGPYSFAPWKVAISGFYKRLEFRCIGSMDGKPVVLDDTSYFLPCQTQDDADTLADLLNSGSAKGFFSSLIFWDEKRPITSNLLASIDLRELAKEVGVSLPAWSDTPDQMLLFAS